MQIIYDTRETKPLLFELYHDVEVQRDKLDFGDYTVVGHDMPGDDHSIIVERKAHCLELAANMGKKWASFQNELEGMSKYRNKLIVVCEWESGFAKHYSAGHTMIHPNFAESRLMEIYLRYGVPTYFFKNRDECESYLYKMFVKVMNYAKNTC